jgi:hypothetical protein
MSSGGKMARVRQYFHLEICAAPPFSHHIKIDQFEMTKHE